MLLCKLYSAIVNDSNSSALSALFFFYPLCQASIHYQIACTFSMHAFFQKGVPAYLCGGQAVADGEAVDCDLDLALVDHVDDGFSCGVHGDDGHGQGSSCVSSSFLVVVTLHLVKTTTLKG